MLDTLLVREVDDDARLMQKPSAPRPLHQKKSFYQPDLRRRKICIAPFSCHCASKPEITEKTGI
jgi:hypothetical protein